LSADPELREARRTTRQVARTFSLACRLLPRGVRDDVYRLYLVFRTLDDLVDAGAPEATERIDALRDWAAGAPARTPETRTLAAIDARRPLPRAPFADFAAGMRDDLAGWVPACQSDLDRYCYRVAGTVGLVMSALLGGGRDADGAAVALGSAMQLTNILRDIDEDAANGRRYLPPDAGSLSAADRALSLGPYIARADELYEAGLAGLPRLEQGRLAIAAAAAMYREILREIERRRGGGRATVSFRRKVRVGAGAGLRAGRTRRRRDRPHGARRWVRA
jgi:15-cis-phytoene synthase